MKYYELTSFKEGISSNDSGAEDDVTFAFSSSSLTWRDLGNALGKVK